MTKVLVSHKKDGEWSQPTDFYAYQNRSWQVAVEDLLSYSAYKVENITVKYRSGEKTRYELDKSQVTELAEVAELKKKLDDLREMLLDETGMTPEYIKLRATRVRRLLSHDQAEALQDAYDRKVRLEDDLHDAKQVIEELQYGPSQLHIDGSEDRRLVERPDPTRVTGPNPNKYLSPTRVTSLHQLLS